jgi:DeoD family purine-nucleoside phosphorylase
MGQEEELEPEPPEPEDDFVPEDPPVPDDFEPVPDPRAARVVPDDFAPAERLAPDERVVPADFVPAERLVPAGFVAEDRLVPDDLLAPDARDARVVPDDFVPADARDDRVVPDDLVPDEDRVVAGVEGVAVAVAAPARPAAPRAAPVTRDRALDSSCATRPASVSSWARMSLTSSTTWRSSIVCRIRPAAADTCSTSSRWRFSVRPAPSRVRSIAPRMASTASAAPCLPFFPFSFLAMGASLFSAPLPGATHHLHPNAPVAERVLLPGDPGRALRLAQHLLDRPLMLNHHRGLWGYTGTAADGEPLTIQSTGMGGPSAAIVAEELITLGASRLIRVGTSGALADGLQLGELIVADAALAEDGASRALGGDGEVAPDPELHAALRAAAPDARSGLIVSADLFYDPDPDRPARWAKRGALAVEMEAATIFRVAAARGARGACVVTVSDIVATHERIETEALHEAEKKLGEVAAAAVGAIANAPR